MKNINIEKFEDILEYKFKNKNLLCVALTHSSYANESKEHLKSNERLEFLGDAVLSIVVSDYIFSNCPDLPEGDLTKLRASLVCEQALSGFSKSIDVGSFLLLSKGERNLEGYNRPSILADAFESIIAAIYLDGGMESAKKFILKFIVPEIKDPKSQKFYDYKTKLQEVVQRSPKEKLEYVLVSESGPDHSKHFLVEVRLNNSIVAKGEGRSKKDAEQHAACQALQVLEQ